MPLLDTAVKNQEIGQLKKEREKTNGTIRLNIPALRD